MEKCGKKANMISNHFYTSEETQGKYEVYEIGDLALEQNGEILRGCKLAYRTIGTLNEAKDNTVLLTCAFAAPGKMTLDVLAGENRGIDSKKYFIICVDQIGSGTSSSPHNTPPPHSMADFPEIRVSDDVRAQRELLRKKFEITELALVIGVSMGGMQTYEWAVRYPDMVKRAAMIAAPTKTSFQQKLFTESMEKALKSDPAWNQGWYSEGSTTLKGKYDMANITTLLTFSPEMFEQELWKHIPGLESENDLINKVIRPFMEPTDTNALISQLRKWRHFDVSLNCNGDMKAALGKIKCRTCVMAFSHDMLFTVDEIKASEAMIADSTYRHIESKYGHGSLLLPDGKAFEKVLHYLQEFLSEK